MQSCDRHASFWRKGRAVFCKSRLIIDLLFILLLLSSCTTSRNFENKGSLRWTAGDKTPKIAVVMPFENYTSEKDIDVLVRKSFYNHFSSKNYHDIELNEVDSVLEILEKTSSQKWRELPASSLCGLFRSDFVIYGRVKEFMKEFFGIYSRISLRVEVEIVEGRSERVVWSSSVIKRSHEGGVPFSLFGIVPAALRSSLHMKKERTLDLIENVNREVVEGIPDPPCPSVAARFIDIQVASFTDKNRALKTVNELELKGLKPRIETVSLRDRLWHRVLLGPYFRLSDAVEIRKKIHRHTPFHPILVHKNPRYEDGNL
jgi:hypothetical protein